MLNKLTKKQIELQSKKRDEWINLALHEQNFDKDEIESGIKWMYSLSNSSEPNVVIVDGPKDFANKLRDSVGASVRSSVWASVRDSVRSSVRSSVGDSVRASVRDSVWASVGDSVVASVGDSVWDSVRDSVWSSVWASVGDSVRASVRSSVGDSVRASVSWTCLLGDSEFGAWYEYWKDIKVIKQQDKADKYVGFLRSGAFYVLFFEKFAFVMLRPTIVKQDERKRLHSIDSPALAFRDGTEIYKLNGVTFDKEWFDKIVSDSMSPDEIFAIDNIEHRRIAYEFMDKSKMKQLKDYKIIDEKTDEKGNPMKIISFTVQNMDEPLKFYNCICPSTGREYFVGTDKNTCSEAKASSFGLNAEEIEFINEW